MGSMFGTDGVRGVANRDLTPDLAFKLGRAGAFILARDNANTRIVIGRDTRISGDMLEAALVAGICSAGVDVLKVGIMPTPAIAYLTRELKAAAGIVISASHNPVEDNGIKFLAPAATNCPMRRRPRLKLWSWTTAQVFPVPWVRVSAGPTRYGTPPNVTSTMPAVL